MSKVSICCLTLLSLISYVSAGLAAYGTCQTGCNLVTMACYSAAGFVFGTVTVGTSTPSVILGCNAAQGLCMTGCAAVCLAPIP